MSLLEGVDYTVLRIPFPNCASEALVLSLGDGSYQILLNSRYSEAVLRARLEHELAHLRADHLYQSERPIAEREAEAEAFAHPSPLGEGGAQRRMRGRPAPTPPSSPAPLAPPMGELSPPLAAATERVPRLPASYRPTGGGYLASWGRAIAWARAQQTNLKGATP